MTITDERDFLSEAYCTALLGLSYVHCIAFCVTVCFFGKILAAIKFISGVSRPVKASPLVLLWTWKTMKSEIYVIVYRSGVRFPLQSSRLVTDSHLGQVGSAFFCKFLNFFSNAFFRIVCC